MFISLLQKAAKLLFQSTTVCGHTAWTCCVSIKHEHATWTWTSAWTWVRRMDMGMQHGHGHAVFTWACSIAATLNAFHSSLYFTLTYSPSHVQSFPRSGYRWCSPWPSAPRSSQMIADSKWFYLEECSKENCVNLLCSNDDI